MTSLPLIAVSQRVEVLTDRGERRDALDQRWHGFLAACGARALPVPNHAGAAADLLRRFTPAAVLLTGGNDLEALGGDAPERDAVEQALLAWAAEQGVPAVGVCRGMQMIAHVHGARLERVEGHVATTHLVTGPGYERVVNSYHGWGLRQAPADFAALARAPDGTVEAMRHNTRAVAAVMWHPERQSAFDAADVALIRNWLGLER